MDEAARIEQLSLKHQSIERIIEEELGHPAVDTIRIAELKKQKLRIKDEIRRIEAAAA